MFWNITIAVILAALAAIVSGLAGHLAATKPWHKWLFWGSGVVMVALIGVQTYRNERAQDSLQKQLDKIQKNTETPPQVTVNIPPAPTPPKTRALVALANNDTTDGVEIQRDKLPPHNLFVRHSCKNISPAVVAKNVACAGSVWKAPAEEGIPTDQTLRHYWGEFSKALAKEFRHSGVDLAPGNGVWGTSDLGMTEIEPEFIKGDKVILLTGAIFYGDEAGSHKKEFCMWAQRPVSPPLPVWHSCDIGHNREVY